MVPKPAIGIHVLLLGLTLAWIPGLGVDVEVSRLILHLHSSPWATLIPGHGIWKKLPLDPQVSYCSPSLLQTHLLGAAVPSRRGFQAPVPVELGCVGDEEGG